MANAKKWAFVSSNPHVSADAGPSWEQWEAQHPPPTVYDPPQLKLPYYVSSKSASVAWMPHRCLPFCSSRSPWCTPCVVACVPCCYRGVKAVDLGGTSRLAQGTDAFFAEMLHDENPNTPEMLRGVFWFKDNVTAPEQLFTLSDADWRSASSGLKAQRFNWTRDATCFGACFMCPAVCHPEHPTSGNIRLEVSPSGKWIWMGQDQLVYIVQPGDVIRDGKGEPLDLPTGSLMRLTFKDPADPRELSYQYIFARVAYKQEDGAIVKTAEYDALRQQLHSRHAYRLSCCGVGLCLDDEELLASIKELSPWQIYVPKTRHYSSGVQPESMDRGQSAKVHPG